MPITISTIPCRAALAIAKSSRGIRLSAPSSEKVLAPTNFLRTNCSKITASVSRVRIRSCSGRDRRIRFSERFHPLLQPRADVRVVDVQELRADVTAIRVLQPLQNFPHGLRTHAVEPLDGDGAVEIGVGQAMRARQEIIRLRPGETERVEASGQVPASAKALHEVAEPVLQAGRVELERARVPVAARTGSFGGQAIGRRGRRRCNR